MCPVAREADELHTFRNDLEIINDNDETVIEFDGEIKFIVRGGITFKSIKKGKERLTKTSIVPY